MQNGNAQQPDQLIINNRLRPKARAFLRDSLTTIFPFLLNYSLLGNFKASLAGVAPIFSSSATNNFFPHNMGRYTKLSLEILLTLTQIFLINILLDNNKQEFEQSLSETAKYLIIPLVLMFFCGFSKLFQPRNSFRTPPESTFNLNDNNSMKRVLILSFLYLSTACCLLAYLTKVKLSNLDPFGYKML